MRFILLAITLALSSASTATPHQLRAVIIDGMNNHDWAAGTAAIRDILESTGRFSTIDVATYPNFPDFSRYNVVINNFNGGHTPPAHAGRPKSKKLSSHMSVTEAASSSFTPPTTPFSTGPNTTK